MIQIMTGTFIYSKVFHKGANSSSTYCATKGIHPWYMFSFFTIFHPIID